ncbi:hypothetical protein T472_0214245 [Youngiibacter fragilis 232.1]|uniref:Uncharacterized protein n=1 Tax=Youngiibacter fragilis 232.1 TaxID=994573 RepID=V7I426_9CLOT|nr:hypothetical protein T472_0214245 [Youngiibacter fragilis 232.1]
MFHPFLIAIKAFFIKFHTTIIHQQSELFMQAYLKQAVVFRTFTNKARLEYPRCTKRVFMGYNGRKGHQGESHEGHVY